jgi:acyl-CoA synthetase (AMP-forming)/AMP-acid ligase II
MTADTNPNVVAAFERTVARVPSRTALVIDHGDRIETATFAELWDRVDRVSAGLVRAGLRPGGRVILMVPLSVVLYAVLTGVLKMGAVAVFVSPWLSPEQIASSADLAEADMYIGSGKSQLLRLRHSGFRAIPISVTTGTRLWRVPARLSLRELESSPGDGTVHSVGTSDPALISFTSGSSGVPKAANRTHDVLAGQQLALADEFPLRDSDVDMTTFPVFALNNLANGVTSVVPHMSFGEDTRVDAARAVSLMVDRGVTTCSASPPVIDDLAGHLRSNPDTRTGLRRIISGGAPVFDAQLASWRDAFPDAEVMVAYGSTEAEPVSHIGAQERLAARSDVRPTAPGICVGRPVGRVRTKLIRIHDGPILLESGDWSSWEMPGSEIGELVVAGDHVCRDYYRNPAATAETKITDGNGDVWHRMGDTGYFDGEGRFWLAGRVHSTIHRAGTPVHPQLVEQAALGDGAAVRRAAAVGVSDAELGERVVLVLEAESTAGLENEVRRRLAESGQTVDEIIISGEPLPLDRRHRAKIDYSTLRERLERAGGRREGGS